MSGLKGMAHGKAPGCDGLPMEFYVEFWPVLGVDLVRVFNSSYSSGLLSCSQRRGVISLSCKKGDRLDPRNWRPITLLNVDYKIASRSIAARLLKVLSLVVERDQSCGIPGGFIGENVAYLRDIVHFCSCSGVPAAILSLDQEKAFDLWIGVSSVPPLRPWVLALHLLTGLCYFIQVSRVLLMSMAISLPSFRCLVGFVRVAPCLPSCIFLLLRCWLPPFGPTLTSLISLFLVFRLLFLVFPNMRIIRPLLWFLIVPLVKFLMFIVYERGSGAKLNLAKCEGLWLGSWNGSTDAPVAISWTSVKIKYLVSFLAPGV